MKYLLFELSMPNKGSWNGRWTGENNYYAIVHKVKNKDSKELKDYYHYDFGDGWAAKVTVKEVSRQEAEMARRKTRGFFGYDWMVQSILQRDQIVPPSITKET